MPVVNISTKPEDLFRIEEDIVIICGSIKAPSDIFFAELFELLAATEFESHTEAIPRFIACIRSLEEKKRLLHKKRYYHARRPYPKPQLIELEEGISYHHVKEDSE